METLHRIIDDYSKIILNRGFAYPYLTSSCKINIALISDKNFIPNVDVNIYNERDFIIGEVNTHFEWEIEKILTTMMASEERVFKIKTDKENEVQLKICLRSFSPPSLLNWTLKEFYEYAIRQKQEGNALFKESPEIAMTRYVAGYVIWKNNLQVTNNMDIAEEDLKKLGINLMNNLALACLKIKNYVMCMIFSTEVLDIDEKNEKALYKLGVTFLHEKCYYQSMQVLRKLINLYPSNVAAKEQLKFAHEEYNKH